MLISLILLVFNDLMEVCLMKLKQLSIVIYSLFYIPWTFHIRDEFWKSKCIYHWKERLHRKAYLSSFMVLCYQ